MRTVLVTRNTQVMQEFQGWNPPDVVVRNSHTQVYELLPLQPQGLICLGPDEVPERGRTTFLGFVRHAIESGWRVAALCDDDSAVEQLYEAGVHDVVAWRSGGDNLRLLSLALKRPFNRAPQANASDFAIMQRAGIVTWVFDTRRWAFTYVSRNVQQLLGYSADNWYRRNYSFKLVHPDDRQQVDAFFRRIVRQQGVHEIRSRMLAAGGRVVWIKTVVSVDIQAQEDVPKLTGIMLDVTGDQHHVQDSLKRIEQERNEIEQHLNRAPMAMLRTNANLEVTNWSPGAEAMFGHAQEDVLGKPWSALGLIHPDDETRVIEELLPLINGQVRYQEVRNRNLRKDGGIVHVHWVNSCLRNPDGTLQSLLSMGRDVSAEIAVEQTRNEQARSEALMALSSGIAHDFNNLLTPILLNAELMEMAVQDVRQMKEKATLIRKHALRAREITAALLQLNRPTQPAIKLIDTATFVDEITEACQALIGGKQQLLVDISQAPLQFPGDESQLFQAVTNLVNNAVHAMGEQGGRIWLRIGRAGLWQQQVVIAVRDEGPGIAPEHQRDIFLPFFTTKRGGKGTGLGLAMVKRICEAHGGSVEVESSPGQGAEFRLLLPADTARGGWSQRDDAVMATAPSRRLRIAVLDDEPAVLESLVAMLQSLGHSCAAFGQSEAAVAALAGAGDAFDVLVSDQTMPGKSGTEVAASLEAAGIRLPVVLVTGTDSLSQVSRALPPNVRAVLRKPVTRAELEQCLQQFA